jgi:cysteinyl-tRNA synthetase
MYHPIHLTDTASKTKRQLVPINAKHVTLYVCGVTPYDHAHIGHARVGVVYDVLFRLLKHVYEPQGVAVHYLQNYTDIDDKIIQRAAETGQTPAALAEQFIQSYEAEMAALGCLPPTHRPRVSTSIPAIVGMVNGLLEKGLAYVTPSGDVMYRTAKFPGFGQLAGRKLDEQQAGARVAVDMEKESPHDFVLWKANAKSATKLEQAFNPTDYGATFAGFSAPGRPGWHIECSAMSYEYLTAHGLGTTLDLHGGGEDLKFPHHCCEIAQTEGLFGAPLANIWLHNAFITVGGTKMSKSLGNFTTIQDALRAFSPQAIRLWLLQTHYRKPVDYSAEAVGAAEKRSQNWHRKQESILSYAPFHNKTLPRALLDMLQDDLNTAGALSLLDTKDSPQEFLEMGRFLGVLGEYMKPEMNQHELALFEAYTQARRVKNYSESDRLRADLKALGIEVDDHKDGSTTWRRL